MPLPHFLLLVAAVILTAGATLVLALVMGVPLQVLALAAGIAAVVVHLSARIGNGPRHTPDA